MEHERPINQFEAKNFRQFVTSFSYDQALSGNLEANHPAIVLPQEFFESVKSMCNDTDRESRGFFLSKKNSNNSQDIFIIESMIKLGYGSGGFVQADDDRFNAAIKLLTQHPEMRAIDYHTHPSQLGSHYSENFSDFGDDSMGGDARALTNALNKNEKYMHVLITATHFLTYGLKLPQFKVSKSTDSNIVMSKFAEWQDKFNEILNNQR
jgi:hypothetical protein